MKSGAQFSCREGLRTLDKGIEGRNSRSSEFLSKFYAVCAADKTRTLGDVTRRLWHEASLPFGLDNLSMEIDFDVNRGVASLA